MINNYGIWGSIYMFFCLIKTKLLFPSARIIRFPIDVRRKQNIDFGKGLTTGRNCRLEVVLVDNKKIKGQILKIGKDVQMNDLCHITASQSVVIGDHVLMASKVYISDVSHGSYGLNGIHSHPEQLAVNRPLLTAPVVIGDNVWLGDGVCVLQGVTIGKNSIIGANAVVTSDIPSNSIAVGIPARIIKQFDFELNEWVSVKNKK